MNYILVVDDEDDIREIYEMVLSRSFPLDVEAAKSGSEALEIINKRGKPEIIISDLRMPDGDGLFLYQSIQEKNLNVPFVICSADSIETLKKKFPNIHGHIEKPMIVGPVVDLIDSIVARYHHEPDYVPVRISLLQHWGTDQFEVFMKLSNSKFIKVINTDETFIASDADRFTAKGLRFLYIKKDDADRYLEKLQKNIAMIVQTEAPVDLPIITLETFEAVGKIAQALGWTTQMMETARHAVNLAIKAVTAEPSLLKLLQQKLSDPKSNYTYHVSTVALISCGFCQQLGWTSESTQMKLGLASLIHDLTLDEIIYSEILAWNAAARNQNDKTPEVMKYRNHPNESATLLLSMKNVPPDVEQILLQHHEMKDGTGFPRGLVSSRITPMASVFIIVEDLVNFLEPLSDVQAGVEEFLRMREEIYDGGSFKKVFGVLKATATA